VVHSTRWSTSALNWFCSHLVLTLKRIFDLVLEHTYYFEEILHIFLDLDGVVITWILLFYSMDLVTYYFESGMPPLANYFLFGDIHC
jgi:hypothetical protein